MTFDGSALTSTLLSLRSLGARRPLASCCSRRCLPIRESIAPFTPLARRKPPFSVDHELTPILRLRAQIFNFLIVEITPIGIKSIGWKFYLVFCIINAAMIPVLWVRCAASHFSRAPKLTQTRGVHSTSSPR